MLSKKRNPASGASHSRVGKIEIPGRKFDNGQYIAFDSASKGAKVVANIGATRERVAGGERFEFHYTDATGRLGQPYRMFSVGWRVEICPIEDVLRYARPHLAGDAASYERACLYNALSRQECRSIVRRNPAVPLNFGFPTQSLNELFWKYLLAIEPDDLQVIRVARLDPEVVLAGETFWRDPHLIFSECLLWWRAPE